MTSGAATRVSDAYGASLPKPSSPPDRLRLKAVPTGPAPSPTGGGPPRATNRVLLAGPFWALPTSRKPPPAFPAGAEPDKASPAGPAALLARPVGCVWL